MSEYGDNRGGPVSNLNIIFLSVTLVCNPLVAPGADEDHAPSVSGIETGSDQDIDSIDVHLKDFRQRKSHIETLLLALRHIVDETQQGIPFELIQNRSRLQISDAEKLYRKGNHFTGRYLM